MYALASRFGIPLERASYRESQDLCFFPEKSPDAFLHRYIRTARPGPIKTKDGAILGKHEGLPFYTVGQRRGLSIGGQSAPLYIVRKEQKSNTIFLAPHGDDLEIEAHVNSLTFTTKALPHNRHIRLVARIRALGQKYPGIFHYNGRKGKFRFATPVRGITPGQSLVLYDGKEIIGGGIIALR